LVENAVKMFAAELVANEARMTFELEPSFTELKIDWVKLDPGRLLQVLINLCTNSIKFTMESPVRNITITVGVSTELPTHSSQGVQYLHQPTDQLFADPTLKTEWGNGESLYLQFQVTDTGRGMSEEEIKLLFQRFSQTSPRTHTREFRSSCPEFAHANWRTQNMGVLV
jgi:signal transduction histidine kinase